MRARLGLIALAVVLCLRPEANANESLFGLGVSSVNHVAASSTFGLGPSVVAITSTSPTIQGTAKPDPPSPVAHSRIAVVRRARSSWLESGRSWSVERLRSHLSTGHAVPSSELASRTFRELADIHDNLHEGFTWRGVTRTTTRTVSSCPGGVCPTNTSQPTRRFFRR